MGTALRTYDAPETAAVEAVPRVYDQRELAAEAQVLRSVGKAIIPRRRRLRAVGGSPAGAATSPTTRPCRGVRPRRPAAVGDHLRAVRARAALHPIYAARRDLATFDFREDYQLGPSLEARAGLALDALGADGDFARLSGSARWTEAWGGGIYRVGAGAS